MRNFKQHILVITYSLPWPLDRGGRIRLNSFFQAFLLDFRITWLVLNSDIDDSAMNFIKNKYPEVRFIFLKTRKQKFLGLQSLFMPGLVRRQYDGAIIEKVKQIINSEKFSHVFIKGIAFVPYVKEAVRLRGNKYKVIFDLDDVESKKYLRQIKAMKFGGGRYFLSCLVDYLKLYYYEKSSLLLFDKVIVASDQDRGDLVKKYPRNEIKTISNSINVPDIAYEDVNNKTILFLGSIGYDPNYDAVIYFLDNIFPLIRDRVPGVKFYIAGPLSKEYLGKFNDGKSVFVLGFVEDLASLYRKTSVVVVPIRIGGGTRIKILEAVAYLKPIVSTSIGSEGLELQNKKHILIEDMPEGFANACCSLMENGDKRHMLAKNAYDFVVKEYSLKNIMKDIIELFN